MTATLSMVPVAQIRPSKANPRAEFDDERMAELIESVKRHGIITPLTLSRDGEAATRSSPGSDAIGRRRRRSSARCPPRCARSRARRSRWRSRRT